MSYEVSDKAASFTGGVKGGIVVFAAALFVGVAVFTAYSTSGVLEREARNTVNKAVDATVQRINSQMSDVENAAKKAAPDVVAHLDDPDYMYKITQALVRGNPFVVGSTVAFEPDYFKEKGFWFAPYTWMEPDGSTHDKQLGNEENLYHEQEWYAETLKAGVPRWSEPYYDVGGYKVMMSTFSVPIKDAEGKVYAILTEDVALDDLSNYVRSIRPYPDSYAELHSAGGIPLVEPPEITHEAHSTVSVSGVADNGWTVELVCPMSVILRDTQSASLRIVLFVAVGLAFVVVVFWFFSSRMTHVRRKMEREAEAARSRIREMELNAELEVAKRANQAKTAFLFNMSHDIRTPMNAILGYTDIALRHFDDEEKAKDSLRKIKASGGHLLNLINDILEMSRIESGKLELSHEPMDLREAVADVEHMSRALAIPKSIDFVVDAGEMANPCVYGDRLHLNEVLINVISNAVKYSPKGGSVRFSIRQTGAPSGGKARYRAEISDKGIGMSEQFQAHIFEAFAREKNATVSKLEGAGLGLSIVKRIVDLGGGTIAIDSKPGKGTTVVIEIPFDVMDDAAVAEFARERGSAVETAANSDLKGKRVLLVEDNELNREIAQEVLKDSGLEVETAEDGCVAVKAVAEKCAGYYDFILMDIQMPVMNGYDATRAIRNLPNGGDVPIIALSANAFDEDKQKSIAAGMNCHVAKPIKVKELLSAMLKSKK